MTAFALLQDLLRRGVVLTPQDGKLIVNAPAGVLSAQDRALLARHKGELLALLDEGPMPADLPAEWHLVWDERAAILEYDGGLPREHAEAAALAEIIQRIRQGKRFGPSRQADNQEPCDFQA